LASTSESDSAANFFSTSPVAGLVVAMAMRNRASERNSLPHSAPWKQSGEDFLSRDQMLFSGTEPRPGIRGNGPNTIPYILLE
jgi:hypothetical protein